MIEPEITRDMLGRTGLITVAKATQTLMNHLSTIEQKIETVALHEAFDRVLAGPIASPEDLPAAARSTMDGFAVRAADTFGASQSMPCYLNITGEVKMGTRPVREVKKGCCFKIPTGGLLPPGSDSVVMLEHTVPVDDTMIEVIKGVGEGSNLMQKGEDITEGTEALPSGHILRPQDLGLLAGLGIAKVTVTKKISVGILSTGDEIIPYSDIPRPGQIRNINSITLAGMTRRAGARPVDYGIVSDQNEIFLSALKKAVEENDIVLFSGGSSVGAKDLGEEAINALGPPGVFVHGVALKPGKPILMGLSRSTPVFGLPGHPVSAMVCFDLFIKPAIDELSGIKHKPDLPQPGLTAKLSRNINSAPGRRDIVRVKLQTENGIRTAHPIMGKSGSISTLSRAHGYFIIDEESQGISEETPVEVYLYQ